MLEKGLDVTAPGTAGLVQCKHGDPKGVPGSGPSLSAAKLLDGNSGVLEAWVT